MHHYFAYNLRIQSEIPLPELPSARPGTDLVISVTEPQHPIVTKSIEFDEAGNEAVFSFPGVGRFAMRDGHELKIAPDPRADQSIFSLYIQGMMLASAMYQRGFFVLHASVVRIHEQAIAFMGPIGAGKSTFASALHARGHDILADDNAAIDLAGPAPQVLPAFPNLKVYPDIAASLGYRPSALRSMHQSQIKQAQPVAKGFWSTQLPLSRIYLLDREAPSPISSSLSFVATMTELIRHSVPTRWSVPGDARHFGMCAQLARVVPVFSVRTFTSLAEIPRIADAIEQHALQAAPETDARAVCMAD